MRSLGIDLGLSVTAFVCLNEDKKIIHDYCFGSKIDKDLKKAVHDHPTKRYNLYLDYFNDFFRKYKYNGTVILEIPMGNFKGGAIHLAEMFGIYVVALGQFVKVDKIYLPTPPEIKKFMTGKGNAGKPQMIKACRRLGYKVTDEHRSDAIAMALMGLEHYQ